MLKDYASSSSSREKPKPKPKRKMGVMVFIIAIVIAAPLLMHVMHGVKFKKRHAKNRPIATKTVAALPKKSDGTSTEFDFYTLLPKMDVPDN